MDKINNTLVVILSVFIFLNLSQFFNTINITSVAGYLYIFFFLALVIIVYILENNKFDIPVLFLYWTIFYLLLASISLIFISDFNNTTFKVYYMLIFNIITIYVYYFIFLLDDKYMTKTLNLMPYIAIIGSVLTIFSFLKPEVFIPLKEFYLNNDHRAVGTYINSNVAGNVLNFLLLVSIFSVKKYYRIPFILLIGLAIVLTFSRSNILLYLFFMIVFSILKVVDWVQIVILFFSFFFLLSFIILNADILSDLFVINISNDQIARLMFFTDNSGAKSIADGSAAHRIEVAEKAMSYFMNNPIIGSGIGITRIWDDSISTHNAYLSLVAEYGLFGITIIPFVLYSVTKNLLFSTIKLYQHIGILFIVYILFTSIFTHNTLDGSVKLGMFALIMAISTKVKRMNNVR